MLAATVLAGSGVAMRLPAQDSITGPDTISFQSGALTLRGILFRPRGEGPFTTILFNHGSGRDYTREVEAVGPAYAKLGYVFFAPSRRGQWLSSATGQYIVDSLNAVGRAQGVAARDPLLVALMKGPQLDDVRAALTWLTTQPFVNPRRIASAGNSFGGIVTVFAAAYLDGLFAAINFAGAAQTWASSPQLQAAMTDAVSRARVPVFFGQAENDYDVTPSRSLSATMTAAGRPNVLRIFPRFGTSTAEGHSLGYFGVSMWGTDVARFLDSTAR
jgi:dienelactone hydrolase